MSWGFDFVFRLFVARRAHDTPSQNQGAVLKPTLADGGGSFSPRYFGLGVIARGREVPMRPG